MACTPPSMTAPLMALSINFIKSSSWAWRFPIWFLHWGFLKHWEYLTALMLFIKSTSPSLFLNMHDLYLWSWHHGRTLLLIVGGVNSVWIIHSFWRPIVFSSPQWWWPDCFFIFHRGLVNHCFRITIYLKLDQVFVALAHHGAATTPRFLPF